MWRTFVASQTTGRLSILDHGVLQLRDRLPYISIYERPGERRLPVSIAGGSVSADPQLLSVSRYGSIVTAVRVGEVAERAGVNVETLRYYERRRPLTTLATSPGAAPRRRRGRRSSTSPTAKAPGTPCGRPRSAVRCCPGKTRSTRGRYQRSHGTSCCARAPVS